MRLVRSYLRTLSGLPTWLRERRLGWLTPLVILLVGLGGLLALAAAAPAISPFVYLLF